MAEEKKIDTSVGEVGKEIGIGVGLIATFEILKKAWQLFKSGSKTAAFEVIKEAGVKAAQVIGKKITSNDRAEILKILAEMEEEPGTDSEKRKAAAKFIREQHGKRLSDTVAYPPGKENLLVDCLAKVKKAIETRATKAIEAGATDQNWKKEFMEFLVWLGKLPPAEFDAAIEFLHHDVVLQWIMMLGIRLNEIFGVIGQELRPLNDKWAEWLNNRRTARGRKTVEYRKGAPHA